jgi:uncharacterized protein
MRVLLAFAILSAVIGAPSLAAAANYAPLVCAKANSPAQLAICRSYSLGQAEARMATLFSVATSLVAMGQRGAISDEQLQWLQTREGCAADIACLTAAYDARIAALKKVIDDIASHGPY